MYMHYVSIVLVTVMASTMSQEFRTTKIRTFNGYKILPSYTTIATTRRSMTECFSYCASISTCWSASWNPTEAMCLGTNELFVSKRDQISEQSSNWKMAAMMRFPVFSMEGPGGHYSLYSLSDAEQVCTSNGAIIADREDLLTARAMGLDQCNCGFMSDGSTGFVMQNQNICWGSFSTDILSFFSMEGPGGHYSLYSLSDAEQVCTSNGAIIADREDLLTARAMGLDQCNCGFMSDGSTGFVMQNQNICWGSFSTDILSCEYIKYYVNVWCKLTD